MPTRHPAKHPIYRVLRHRRLTYHWLSQEIGYSATYICNVLVGRFPAPPEFRWKCAVVLNLPEDVLFLPEEDPFRPEGDLVPTA